MDKSLEIIGKEISLRPDVPGGMSEYRMALTKSFFLKFMHHVISRSRTNLDLLLSKLDGHADVENFDLATKSKFFFKAKRIRQLSRKLAENLEHKHELKGLQHFRRDEESFRSAIGAPNAHVAAGLHVTGRA